MKTLEQVKVQTFDFRDGNGSVPAHRHTNPDGTVGGWVAETAKVENTAWISGDTQVYGNALVYGDARISGNALVHGNAWVYGNAWVSGDTQVYGDARVYGNAQVYGNALVYGDAQVYGGEWTKSPLYIQGTARAVYMSSPTDLGIGYLQKSLVEWLADINGEHNTGKKAGYTQEQMDEYDRYVRLAAAMYAHD